MTFIGFLNIFQKKFVFYKLVNYLKFNFNFKIIKFLPVKMYIEYQTDC